MTTTCPKCGSHANCITEAYLKYCLSLVFRRWARQYIRTQQHDRPSWAPRASCWKLRPMIYGTS